VLGLVEGDTILKVQTGGDSGPVQVQRIRQDGQVIWSVDLPAGAIAWPVLGGHVMVSVPEAGRYVLDGDGRMSAVPRMDDPGCEHTTSIYRWEDGGFMLAELYRKAGSTTASVFTGATGSWNMFEIPTEDPILELLPGGMLYVTKRGATAIPTFLPHTCRQCRDQTVVSQAQCA
jgi:hypothetical protein